MASFTLEIEGDIGGVRVVADSPVIPVSPPTTGGFMGGVAKLFEFFQTFYQIYNNPAFKQLVDVLLKLFEASKAQTVTESELKACVAEARAALDQIEANAGQTVLALNAPPPMSLTMP